MNAIRQALVLRTVTRWVGVFLLIALATWTSLITGRRPQHVAPFWWANALLAAVLLLNRRSRWAAYLTAGFAGALLAHFVFHDSLTYTLIAVSVDTAEAALTAWIVLRILGNRPNSIDSIKMFRLTALILLGVCFPVIVSGLSMGVILHLLSSAPVLPFFERWFPPNALGIAIFTPLVLVLFRRSTMDLFRRQRLLQTSAFSTVPRSRKLGYFRAEQPSGCLPHLSAAASERRATWLRRRSHRGVHHGRHRYRLYNRGPWAVDAGF